MPSIYERKTVAGQIGRDGGAAWEDSAIKSDKRKVNNPSAEGKERSVIFMGSYDRVPLLFSLLFPPPLRARRRKEGEERRNVSCPSTREGMMARGLWPACREARDEMNRDQGRASHPLEINWNSFLRTRDRDKETKRTCTSECAKRSLLPLGKEQRGSEMKF